jgi:SAM-dependent methyltransferase
VRRRHFDALQPLCVVCHAARVTAAGDGDVIEGIATCTNEQCLREYPIIDGIPIFVANIRAWLSANPLQVLLRDDLSPEIESLLGDVLGPGSAYDTLRHHVGIYAGAPPIDIDPPADGPAIDIGCAVGVNTFAMARQLTVGVDLNFAMLRAASRPHYDRRRVGLVYDRVAREVPQSELVDFWCCDAANLPFAPATFAHAQSVNVIDCLAAPRAALAEMARVLRPGGTAVIATPYDWSPSSTPVEQWLGGHSQRGATRGASEPMLRRMLDEVGLQVVSEEESRPWRVRVHDRSTVEYAVHVVRARRAATTTT